MNTDEEKSVAQGVSPLGISQGAVELGHLSSQGFGL